MHPNLNLQPPKSQPFAAFNHPNLNLNHPNLNLPHPGCTLISTSNHPNLNLVNLCAPRRARLCEAGGYAGTRGTEAIIRKPYEIICDPYENHTLIIPSGEGLAEA